MKEYLINIDLYCYRRDDSPKSYRLYVDGDLITERTYIWINNVGGKFVRENVWVNLEPGEHEIKIESVVDGKFYFKNLNVDKIPIECKDGKFTVN